MHMLMRSDKTDKAKYQRKVWASKIYLRVIVYGQNEAMRVTRRSHIPATFEPWRIPILNDL